MYKKIPLPQQPLCPLCILVNTSWNKKHFPISLDIQQLVLRKECWLLNWWMALSSIFVIGSKSLDWYGMFMCHVLSLLAGVNVHRWICLLYFLRQKVEKIGTVLEHISYFIRKWLIFLDTPYLASTEDFIASSWVLRINVVNQNQLFVSEW